MKSANIAAKEKKSSELASGAARPSVPSVQGVSAERKYKIRHINFFACVACGRPRAQSLKKKNAVIGLCRKCRCGVAENPDQTTLFG